MARRSWKSKSRLSVLDMQLIMCAASPRCSLSLLCLLNKQEPHAKQLWSRAHCCPRSDVQRDSVHIAIPVRGNYTLATIHSHGIAFVRPSDVGLTYEVLYTFSCMVHCARLLASQILGFAETIYPCYYTCTVSTVPQSVICRLVECHSRQCGSSDTSWTTARNLTSRRSSTI